MDQSELTQSGMAVVDALNVSQVRAGPMPMHPLTCGHRDEPGHGDEGGDCGVLIALDNGTLQCPYCKRTQEWIPPESFAAAMAPPPVESELPPDWQEVLQVSLPARMRQAQAALERYQLIADEPGVARMMDSLRRFLEAHSAR